MNKEKKNLLVTGSTEITDLELKHHPSLTHMCVLLCLFKGYLRKTMAIPALIKVKGRIWVLRGCSL